MAHFVVVRQPRSKGYELALGLQTVSLASVLSLEMSVSPPESQLGIAKHLSGTAAPESSSAHMNIWTADMPVIPGRKDVKDEGKGLII